MNYQYIEAPNHPVGALYWPKTIFLAGSITGASDWQVFAKNSLLSHFNVFNPRRANFDVTDENVEREQITWEYTYLSKCEIVMFYFAPETLAPITLLEYGAQLEESKVVSFRKLYIAIHPEYKRKNDVSIQTELRNPRWGRNINFSLGQTINQIIKDNE